MIRHCSGCKACENICPTGCLRIVASDREFQAEVDRDKCINCGKCLRVCPMKRRELHQPMEALVSFSKDAAVVRASSSGGIAALIYRHCISNNMSCVGVRFDDEFNLVYGFIHDGEDVAKAVGSKYVYSDMNTMYQKIESKLKNSEKVVMIGLPCHVSGLKNYCMEKGITTDNLYTVDLVCHGVPMPYIFKKHLHKILENTDEPVNIYFREKDNPFGLTVIKTNGKSVYKRTRYQDEYMYLYLSGERYAEACYGCPYATENRCGDMTIKDYCDSRNAPRIKNPLLYGASHVLINTVQGQILFEMINDDRLYMQMVSVNDVVNADSMLQHPTSRPEQSKLFYRLERWLGMKWAVRMIYGRQMSALTESGQSASDKYLELFRVMSQWVKIKQEGKNLSSYFIRYGYGRIAIYGLSRAGETLVNELEGTGIEIAYGIDRNAAVIRSDIVIVSMMDSLEKVDAVVVTAVTDFEGIKEELMKKMDCPIISLRDILYEVSG